MGTIYVILIYECVDNVWHACVYIDVNIYIHKCVCVNVEFKGKYCLK